MDLKKRPARWSRRCLMISAAVAFVVILAIVIPLAVIIPRQAKYHSSVLLSLYIYPTNLSSWGPLFKALEAHPRLEFVCIVNPKSGPGDSQYPDAKYDAAVRKLNSYKNAKTIGYVRVGYADVNGPLGRNISIVEKEVDIYAGWGVKSPELAMRGIFFDESPHQYLAESIPFMKTVTSKVKGMSEFKADRMVVRNPGVIPDSRYQDDNTDVTVIFEETYKVFESRLATIQSQPKTREKYAFFINAVPTQSKDSLSKLVKSMGTIAKYLYLTEEGKDFYESFGTMWPIFTDVLKD